MKNAHVESAKHADIIGFLIKYADFMSLLSLPSTSLLRKARFKRRILHVLNLMQMRKIYCFRSFALDSAHVKCDV